MKSEKDTEVEKKKGQNHNLRIRRVSIIIKMTERSYFNNLITLPFLPRWQIIVCLSITVNLIFALYTSAFNTKNSRYPAIEYVNIINYWTLIMVTFCEGIFVFDLIILIFHRFSKKTRMSHPYERISLIYITVGVITSLTSVITIASDILHFYNILKEEYKFIKLVRIINVFKIYRLYTIYDYSIHSIQLDSIVVFFIYLSIIVKTYALIGTIFAAFFWSTVSKEHGITAEETLHYLVPMMNEHTLSTWRIKTQFDMFLRSIYVTCNTLLTRGQVCYVADNALKSILYQITMFLSMVFNIILIAVLSIIMVHSQFKNIHYHAIKDAAQRKISLLEITKSTKDGIMLWYKTLWEHREGVLETNLMKLLPSGMYQDCCLDANWPAFKHSQIFRNMDTVFLTDLSLNMKNEFHCAGDVIYAKGMWKSAMFYVQKGVVQVLSCFDNSTPIISFFPGTCFGESTLFARYPCHAKIICATYCELKVLRKTGILKLMKYYPNEIKSLQNEITVRYVKAQRLYALKMIYKEVIEMSNLGRHSDGTLKRIKRISRAIDRTFSKGHSQYEQEDRLNSLLNSQNIRYDYIGTSSDYLDEVTISESTENSNISFITTTCPIILHPNSPVIKIWNTIMTAFLVILLLLIPFEAGIGTRMSPSQVTVSVICQLVFIIDLIVQCTFAVSVNDKSYRTMNDIFFYRLSTPEFKADLIGSIPINFLTVFYNLTNVSMWGILKINYTLRAWRLVVFFRNQTSRTFRFRQTVALLTYLCYFFFSLCYWAMAINLSSCFNSECSRYGLWYMTVGNQEDRKDNIRSLIISIVNTMKLCLGEGGKYIIPYNRLEHITILLMNMFYFFINSYFIAAIASIGILMIMSQEFDPRIIKKALYLIESKKISKGIQIRMLKHLRMQKQLRCNDYFKGNDDLVNVSDNLKQEVKLAAWAQYITKVPLFKGTDRKFINDIVNIAFSLIYPPNEVIMYSAMSPRFIYIIKRGYVKVYSETEQEEGEKGPGWYFGLLEVLLDIPTLKTVQSLTSLEAIIISKKHLRSVLLNYPDNLDDINKTKEKCSQMLEIPTVEVSIRAHSKEQEVHSFYHFGYNLAPGSRAEKEFLTPFKKELGNFVFIQYLLLRTVILPSGKAIWILEIIRSIIALCSSILFPAKPIFLHYSQYYQSLFLFLDICAYIGIYIQLHVAYYNNDGILVKHPIMTANHYLKNSFITDLIGCLPFEVFFSRILPYRTAQYWLCYNRVLQSHRIYGLLNYIPKTQLYSTLYTVLLKYLIFIITIINLFASIAFNLNCKIEKAVPKNKNSFLSKGINCPDIKYNAIIFGSVITPAKMYLIFNNYITMLITQVNILTFGEWDKNQIFTMVTGFFAYAVLIYMMGQITAHTYIKKHGIRFQREVKNLTSFLEVSKAGKALKEDFVNYYNLLWDKYQGQNPNSVIQTFNYALKNDIRFDIYGTTLMKYSIFRKASKTFNRNLLLKFITQIYHKGSHITKEGFIHGNVYLLHEGFITIFSGQREMVKLGRGTLFGNLHATSPIQQPITVIAHTSVEILMASSKEVYMVLNAFPASKDLFLTALKYYSRSGFTVLPGEEDHASFSWPEAEQPDAIIRKHNRKTFTSNKVEFCKAIISLFTSLIAMYIISVREATIGAIIILYICDFLSLISMLLNCRTPYKDKVGEYVTDSNRIKQNYRNKKIGFWFDLFTVFPFETLWFAFKDETHAFLTLRFNRTLKYINFLSFLTKYARNISDKQSTIRIYLAMFNFYSFMYFITCIFLFIFSFEQACFDDLKVYDRIALFMHAFIIKESILANFPTHFILPSRNTVFIFARCILMAVSVIIKSVLIGHVLFFIEAYHGGILSYIQERQEILSQLKVQGVTHYLINITGDYLKFLWDKNKGTQVPDILHTAPITLQQKLLKHLYDHHIKKHHIFSECHNDFLDHLILHVTTEKLMPGNTILKYGTKDGNMYFIHKGLVVRYSNVIDNKTELTILPENKYFGTKQGLDDTISHKFTYKAHTVVTIIKLNVNSWKYLLDYYPLEKIRLMKSTIKEMKIEENLQD